LKKIILFLLLVSSLYSDAKLYLGSSVGYFTEDFNNDIDAQSSTTIGRFKAGYGVREAYAIEFTLDYVQNRSKIFSSSNTQEFDGDKYGLNIEFVKAFDYDIFILPFLKAGFGTGFLDIQRETQNILHYGSYNVGVGSFIPISEHFDFEIGYDYKFLSYEAIDIVAKQVRYESNVNIFYFGFNVRY